MSTISIIIFFLYCWGFGIGLGSLVKESEDFIERNLMRLGIGLGAIPAFGLLFNLTKIPLDWRIFLFIGIIPILVLIIKGLKQGSRLLEGFKGFKINTYILIMLILFFISFYMYVKGAFINPYLEDDDSWSHAIGIKYVSIEKTVFTPTPVANYIEPYPPTYDMLLGILHQTNNSVYWTLKFFNALIVSLSIIFFYFFAKVFTNSSKKALFSTFALFAVPAFLSHFIWALALTVPLYFVSFYAVEKIKNDKKWWIIAGIVMITTLTSSPTHSTYFGLFFIIYFVARTIVEKRFLIYEFLAGLAGLLLSFTLWWGYTIIKYGFKGFLQNFGISGVKERGVSAFSIGGTGDRIYALSDFIFAKDTNMINNPIGIGIVLSILTIMGLIFLISRYKEIFKKENYYKLVVVLWFIFTFYAVNASRFFFKLSPFRAWMLLAIPVSLLSGEAINLIDNFVKLVVKNFIKSKILIITTSLVVLGLVAYGIITTSFIQKYAVNTALWPPGAFWTSNEEIQGYIWFKNNIPNGAKVFTFVNNAPIIGFDKFTCHWCSDVRDFQKNGINKTSDEIYSWLEQKEYQYLVVDGQTAKKFGSNETNNMLRGLSANFNLQPVFQNNGIIILKI